MKVRLKQKAFCSDEGLMLETSAKHSLWHSAYPHQPYVDTLYVLLPHRCRPKLVLTGTSIPLYQNQYDRMKMFLNKVCERSWFIFYFFIFSSILFQVKSGTYSQVSWIHKALLFLLFSRWTSSNIHQNIPTPTSSQTLRSTDDPQRLQTISQV